MKRIIALLAAFLLLFSVTVSAESKISLKPDGEFITETEKIAEIIGMEKDGILDFCIENNIIYIAVNKDNSKQIRVTEKETDFSKSIVNINGLSEENINELLPDIIGIEGVKGEVLNKNGQKFIKTELSSSDSGGEYILTEYITVANKKVYVLSFYTASKTATDYIEKTFKTFESPYFINEINSSIVYVVIAFAIFLTASVIIVITIIKDLKVKEPDS